jgi:acyl carrier protein
MRAVRRFVEEKYGRLDGIVFAAGRTTLHRSVFEETGVKECEAHFEAKVHGLMVLERVFDETPLDFCVVLSSLSTILGGLGHMAYSAANQVADALVYRRNRARRDAWITANWDAWQFDELADAGSGMKAALTRLSMLPREGVDAFDLLLRLPVTSQVIISTGHLQSRVDDWIALRTVRSDSDKAQDSARSYARPALDTPFVEPEGDLERRVAEIWKSTLGLDRIGRNDDFFELGGHSLLAIQVLAQVRQVFGVDFPIDRAFEATTVRKAAEVVDELLREKISRLTDAEAEELLKQSGLAN